MGLSDYLKWNTKGGDMKFSIICPTRGRVNFIRRSLLSIQKHTYNIDNVEVLLAVDNDDEEMENFWFKGVNLRIYKFDRKECFGEYYNDLAKKATGDVIWVWSDEVLLCTNRWDHMVEKKVKKSRWKVWLGETSDFIVKDGKTVAFGHPITQERFSCFPMVSREAYEALGYVHVNSLRVWGADLYLFMTFKHVGRIIRMDKIELMHAWKHDEAKRAIYREDLERMVKVGKAVKLPDNRVGFDIADDVKRLRDYIGEPVLCAVPPKPTLKKHWWDCLIYKAG